MIADLPDLRGWLPARVLARRLGVSPGTVRARASRGVYEVTPNPIGPGALYREKTSTDAELPGQGGKARTTADNDALGALRGLGGDDRLTFAHLGDSASGIARRIGLAPGTVDRSLHRLERAGLARRGEAQPTGPSGGRPAIIWRAA